MCAARRLKPAPLIEQLLEAPQRFEFVQAVRILLVWLGEQGVDADAGLRVCLRFENSLQLSFPGSEIEALTNDTAAGANAGADVAAHGAGTPLPRFTLTPGFMGLLGVHGTLPLHLTERIAAWQCVHHDEAPRAFVDMLSGRMLALFYRAWHKHRLVQMDGGLRQRGDMRSLLLALAGRRPAPAPAVSALPTALATYFAGLIQQRPLSAAALERMLADYFAQPVRVLQALGYWERLLPDEQAALAVNALLGATTLLGARSWRPDLRARVRIGPLRAAAFADFLPSGSAAAALRAILAAFAEPTVSFEVQLVLHGGDVRASQLACVNQVHACLGRDSFLISQDGDIDRADMRYVVWPMAALAALPALARPGNA